MENLEAKLRDLVLVRWESRGGDAPLGWSSDSWTVEVAGIPVSQAMPKKEWATPKAEKLRVAILEFWKSRP
jgi:hypothetical protein